MIESLPGLALRQVRTRRLRAVLTMLGIVLGVGMVSGVLMLSGTIRHTFDDMVDSAWGTKDIIVMPQGGALLHGDLQRVRTTPGVRDASPMVGGTVVRFGDEGRAIRGASGRIALAGYDTGTVAPYDFEWRNGHPPSGRGITLEDKWAGDHGYRVGDTISLGTPSGRARLRIVGIFGFSNGLNFAGQGLATMSLAAARDLLDVPRGWHQISVRLDDRGKVEQVSAELKRRLGRGVRVQTPAGFGEDIKSQLSALDVVLYFFAGVALFVGGFLILNSFSMTVAQRTRELGMLRTMGATRRQVRRSVMVEAILLGVVGSLLGIVLGLGLALGLVALIRGLGIPVSGLQVTPTAVVVSVLLGLGATAAGAWWPSRRAARISPIRAAQSGSGERRRSSWRRIAIGVALYVPGAVWGGSFWFGEGSGSGLKAAAGIAMTMAMFAGMALAAPAIIGPLVRGLSVPLARIAPTGGRLAADAARRNPTRTAATAIALTIGLSVVVVNSAMSSSFVGSVKKTIDRTYAQDVLVRPVGADLAEGGDRVIGTDAQRAIAALPDVGTVSPMTLTVAELPGLSSGNRYGLIEGLDPRTLSAVSRPSAEGIDDADVAAALERGEALIARGYAEARSLAVGETFTLSGPRGSTRLRVAGITDEFNDFGGNTIQLSAAMVARLYGVTLPTRLFVTASSPDRREALRRSIDRLTSARFPQLEGISTAELKQDITDQVNQQFALFNAILAVAVLVSLLGVVNTLAMSVIERTREIGVLRALGSSRWLVRMTMVHEGILITAAGALAGLALGLVIAFCWVQSLRGLLPDIVFVVPVSLVAGVALAAVVLGTAAATLPARRAARLDVVDALAYE